MIERVPLSDRELEDIIGRSKTEYESIPFSDVKENVREALNLMLSNGMPVVLKERFTPVKEGLYKSGDVWMGAYNIVYLYLGQFKNKAEDGAGDATPCDVVITVGGDTPLIFETNYVHQNQQHDYFLRRIFPAENKNARQ